MTLHILRPGMLTTVQDLGRYGHQSEGVPVSGAMDHAALRIANLLVGNDDRAAALEITLTGPVIRFENETLVALAGADLGAHLGAGGGPSTSLDGQPIPPWRPILIPAGAVMGFHGSAAGCRAYLAVSGGIAVPSVLGSRSTFARAGLGGYAGRALQGGDVLPCGDRPAWGDRIAAGLRAAAHSQSAASQAIDGQAAARATIARWGAGPTLRPRYAAAPVVRLLPGAHHASLTQKSREALYRTEFSLSPRSDRTGYRLEGAELRLAAPLELLSEAVAFGTLQLPPGGEPILLMADRHTTGGYPRIGEVAAADLPLVAQLRPGDSLRFRPVSLEDAESLSRTRERDVAVARLAVALRSR